VLAVVREFGSDEVKAALRRAIGEDRENKLIGEKAGPALSKDDNRAIIREVYHMAPGESEDAKMVWAMETFEPCFETRERYLEVLQFVRARVEADKAQGGTIDAPPVPKPEPEAQWRRDLATIKAVDGVVEFYTRNLSRPSGGGHNADEGMEWIISRITGHGFDRLLLMVMGGGRNPSRIYFDGEERNGLFSIPMMDEAHWKIESSGGTLTVYLNGKSIWTKSGGYHVTGAVMNGYAKRHSTGEWRV
jgi:hypothetical protein